MLNREFLKYCVARSGLNGIKMAERMGISTSAYQKKATERNQFTIEEVTKIKEILNLSDKEFLNIFFGGSDSDVEEVLSDERAVKAMD